MSTLEKLAAIQQELKAPKNQKNTFGGYNYRSCEDILEAVKPLCKKHKCLLILSDTLVHDGDRYYIQATARLYDTETGEYAENTALAREAETKKGMDDSQITGTASSYARKYALNGLFCIDDTKDADTDEYKRAQERDKAAYKPDKAEEKICCKVCGGEIKAAQKGGQTITAADFAKKTGGVCMKCYKQAQLEAAREACK